MPHKNAGSAQDSPLGRVSSYRSAYDPTLLFPIARAGKRAEIGIAGATLPFVGVDLWNAYELSWLNPRGKPQVAIGEFRVPADSPRLIESKSLKLYLNSFNQTRLANIDEVASTIARDLSAAADATVSVAVHPVQEPLWRSIAHPSGFCLDGLDVEIERYTPEPAFLSADPARTVVDELLYSHLLKSNCLVTGQPDWGMVAIRYTGPAIEREGLLRYIVSLREHNEFHEHCVERIFMDILRRCEPARLAVWARYTRRGGVDINPFRASEAGFAVPVAGEVRQ